MNIDRILMVNIWLCLKAFSGDLYIVAEFQIFDLEPKTNKIFEYNIVEKVNLVVNVSSNIGSDSYKSFTINLLVYLLTIFDRKN